MDESVDMTPVLEYRNPAPIESPGRLITIDERLFSLAWPTFCLMTGGLQIAPFALLLGYPLLLVLGVCKINNHYRRLSPVLRSRRWRLGVNVLLALVIAQHFVPTHTWSCPHGVWCTNGCFGICWSEMNGPCHNRWINSGSCHIVGRVWFVINASGV